MIRLSFCFRCKKFGNMFQGTMTFVRSGCKNFCTRAKQLTNSEICRKRNALFSEEKARQMALITRIEKVQVVHHGPPEDCTLLMNKNLSTPFNVAMHIGELLMNRSVVALVNGEPWDMHKPFTEDCELQFLHFKDDVPDIPNQVFWRSCSFILGHILERAFKDEIQVELCSFPRPNVRSGSFVYDADLKLPDWKPTSAELNCLSRIGAKLQHDDIRFERLDVDISVALKMFDDNRFKTSQIPSIAAQSSTGCTVPVYRMGDHIDITRGPLMSSTRHIARYSVTAVSNIDSPDFGTLKRIQGLAIPTQLPIHYWAYEMLCERSTNLNKAPVPTLAQDAPIAMENTSHTT